MNVEAYRFVRTKPVRDEIHDPDATRRVYTAVRARVVLRARDDRGVHGVLNKR